MAQVFVKCIDYLYEKIVTEGIVNWVYHTPCVLSGLHKGKFLFNALKYFDKA